MNPKNPNRLGLRWLFIEITFDWDDCLLEKVIFSLCISNWYVNIVINPKSLSSCIA